MDENCQSTFCFEEEEPRYKNLPTFGPLLDDGEASPVRLDLSKRKTESLDLSTLFNRELTESGSFDVRGVKHTSFGRLLLALPIPALVIDKSFNVRFCNEAWGRIGGSYQKMEGRPFSQFFQSQQEAAEARSLLQEIFEKRKPKVSEQKLHIENKTIWTRIYFRPLRGAQERVILCLIEDLTLEKRQIILMDKITRAKKEWELTFDIVPDMIALIDGNYRIRRLNAAMAERVGVSLQKAIGQPCFQLIHGMDKPPEYCPYVRMLNDGLEHSEEYYEGKLSAYFMETVSPIKNGNGFAMGCVLVARDITDRKCLEKELTYRATHDMLTMMFNRCQMMEMLDAACQTAARYDLPISLCMCDIDDFKRVNDEHGHQAGDHVLIKFAEILKQELRKADFAGRYAGDEFLIVFPNTNRFGAAESIERIRARIDNFAFEFGTKRFHVTCSFGVAELSPGISVDQLIGEADRLLYVAKRRGGNQIGLHDEASEVPRQTVNFPEDRRRLP
jgi:diguanylate cyclase (GGDEF)-like protein/PAS domain S-box-containing protein